MENGRKKRKGNRGRVDGNSVEASYPMKDTSALGEKLSRIPVEGGPAEEQNTHKW